MWIFSLLSQVFLISSHIFKSLDKNNFSFIDFYQKRILRIFPALLVVFVSSIIFGWVALFTEEYTNLVKHILGFSYFNNFILFDEVGYWDTQATLKPFLHLWSLAIEEQFYLTIPLILFISHKLNFRKILILLIIFVSSILFMKYQQDMNAKFYLPQNRFWELLVGIFFAYFCNL